MRRFMLLFGVVSFTASCSQDAGPQRPARPSTEGLPPIAKAELANQVVKGPFTHENLSVFVICGRGAFEGRKFLTLQEGLEQGQARVLETGNVNELAVENLSADRELFIQAGEIVRGGKQDRVMGVDMLLAPRSGKVPIGAFCVEHGRWTARGTEASASFSSSTNQVSSNSMKMAIVQRQDQGLVWDQVGQAQRALSDNVGADVAAPASTSSLELSLENKEVEKRVREYVEALSKDVAGQGNAVGLAVAINGKMYNADVYASAELFKRLWPKLLEAAATEAIAQLNAARTESAPTPSEVRAFMIAAEDARISMERTSTTLKTVLRESENSFFSETLDTARGNAWLHRSYMKKPPEPLSTTGVRSPSPNPPQQIRR